MSDTSETTLRLRVTQLERDVSRLHNAMEAVHTTLQRFNMPVIYPQPESPPAAIPAAPPEPRPATQKAPPLFAEPEWPELPPRAPAAPPPPLFVDVRPDPSKAPESAPATAHRPPATDPATRHRPPAADPATGFVRTTEYWLNKVGIALFLIGVMFFFKYSIDRGWITPALRVMLGGLAGFGFIGVGLRLPAERRAFGQVMLGGGIAILYISVFAAFQFYQLLAFPVAFGAMVGVTTLGMALALRQDQVVLSLIAAIGGLGTPFLLYTGNSNVPGLMTYTCLLLAGTCAIYAFKGWRSLLWTTQAGALLILGLVLAGLPLDPALRQADRWALQAGTLAVWLLFWLSATARALRTPPDGPPEGLPNRILLTIWRLQTRLGQPAHQLALGLGLFAAGFTPLIWQLGQTATGWTTLAFAAAYACAGAVLRRLPNGRRLAGTQAMVATVLLTVALALLLHGDVLFWTLAAEAAALPLLARRFDDGLASLTGHALALGVGYWFVLRIPPLSGQPAILNPRALTELASFAILYAASFLMATPIERRAYQTVIHGFMLIWLWRELEAWPSSVIMAAWTIYGIGLLLAARRSERREFAVLGHVAFAGVLIGFVASLADNALASPAMNTTRALVDVAIMAAAYAVSRVRRPEEKLVYRLVVHGMILGWFWRELLDYNPAWTGLAWAANALILHLIARRERTPEMARAAYGVLGHVVVSLVLGQFALSLPMIPRRVMPLFNQQALVQLATLAAIAAAGRIQFGRDQRQAYYLAAHVALLAWFARELSRYDPAWTAAIWAIDAAALGFIARRTRQRGYEILGHVVAGLVLLQFAGSLARPPWRALPVINQQALLQLAAISLVAAASRFQAEQPVRRAYGLVAYAALLTWFWREWSVIANGNAYTTLSWSICSLALFVVGLRGDRRGILQLAVATLGLVLFKLFLIDLVNIDAIWRILLFLGLGGGLLGLS
ncbi:MAG TPA: DUF2339 domain-containing protein, partial [Herpetosiphonaceae bacterium]|nr:DUF2339 domain-containing protein [Herpetosiphonaceae bacterium]